ncbi:hypothetical protein cyc_04739 [Cyclospora cayetanensis]|uniref:Uncharacterized protein n=1 Tax=Cyclospora cayetanensis TaxID=88456 RepID=A0A1D3D621_9EIME|nr:hypothetical protein cyc_04739 [Cyclospora cayetanensis]
MAQSSALGAPGPHASNPNAAAQSSPASRISSVELFGSSDEDHSSVISSSVAGAPTGAPSVQRDGTFGSLTQQQKHMGGGGPKAATQQCRDAERSPVWSGNGFPWCSPRACGICCCLGPPAGAPRGGPTLTLTSRVWTRANLSLSH